MEIYLVRHGIAEEPLEAAQSGRSDPQRMLTKEGFQRTTKIAEAFSRKVKTVDLILHSPYVRAVQTAEIFAGAFPSAKISSTPGLTPMDEAQEVVPKIEESRVSRLMLVGHEPHMSSLLSYLLTGGEQVSVGFKRAGIAGVEWGGVGSCRLLFLLPPKMLLT